MQESLPNRHKIKLVTLKYLYEIAAIPETIREKYRQKLITCPVSGNERRNVNKRKNIRLLDIINDCIKKENFSGWNDENICRILNISKNMLYCHKHYILKELRIMYFNWEKIEEEQLKNNYKCQNDIEYEYKKAYLMYEIGMTREAKNKFIKICKQVEAKRIKNINDELILLKSCEKLCFYYFNQKNRYKFNILYSRIEKGGRKLLRKTEIKENNFFSSEINITLYHCLIKKLGFNIKGQNNYPQIIDLFKQIYREAKRINDIDLECKVLINLGIIFQDLMQFDKAIEYNKKGLQIATKNNKEQEKICFLISITAEEYYLGLLNFSDCLYKMTELNNSLNAIFIKKHIKEQILFQFFCIGTVSDRSDLLCNFLKEYNSYNLIINGYKSTMRMLYYEKFTYYLNNIFIYNNVAIPNSSEKFIIVSKANKDIIKKLEDLEVELLLNFDKRYTLYFTLESYIFMFETEFCKGRNMNFERITDIYNKIEWLIKTRSKIFQNDDELYELIAIIKLCSQIIEGSRHLKEKDLLKKYEQNLDSFFNRLLENKKENIISYFSFLSYTAEQSDSKIIRNNVKELYFKLEEKYPGIFSSIKEQIEHGKYKRINAVHS